MSRPPVAPTGSVAQRCAPDVCLVTMPYASPTRPSLALGLLKSLLAEEGIDAHVAQANLWFAEKVGLRLYQLCSSHAPTVFLMGEWTFAAAAFPEDRGRDEEYLSQVMAASGRSPAYLRDPGEMLIADLRSLRAAATEFVDDAAKRILATGARVVGCTSTFEQHVASLALLRRIRELDPEVITMMGGANCETVMGETTHRCFPWVDYVVSGEADGLITKLCTLAQTRGRDVEPADLPRGVLGPCHRAGASGPAATRPELPRALFHDLDTLPVPQFGEYFEALAASPLRASVRPGLPLETSRGCWWGAAHQCTFCGLNGSSLSYRSKSPGRVLAEIRELEERHGISDFEVVDNILDMRYFTTLVPALAEEGRGRRIFYEVKANLTRAQVEALQRAGITWVQPGIESLHTEVLQLMDKGVRGWQNVQLLKWARELGVRLTWSLLWGFPGENDQHYQEMAGWIPALEHLQPPGSVARLRYDRYSVYHAQAQRLGMMLFPVGAMAYVYPVSPADLDGLAYFFSTSPAAGPLDLTDGVSREVARRPGVRAAGEAVSHWRKISGANPRPVLSVTDHDGVLDIVDSRSCARSPRLTLRGLDRAACLACDAAPRPGKLAEIIRRDHGLAVSDQEVAAAAENLIRHRLVLPMDGRLVGVAVAGSSPRIQDPSRFPGGHVDLRGTVRGASRRGARVSTR